MRILCLSIFYINMFLEKDVSLIGAICVPMAFMSTIEQAWNYGKTLCYLFSVTISASLNASLITLSLISLERYSAVTKPLRYRIGETFI